MNHLYRLSAALLGALGILLSVLILLNPLPGLANSPNTPQATRADLSCLTKKGAAYAAPLKYRF
jgi:hypothetical protein